MKSITVALNKAHLIIILSLVAILSFSTTGHDVCAGTGDRGGGGNSVNPGAVSEDKIINNLSLDVKRVAFNFLNYLNYSLTFREFYTLKLEDKDLNYKKLFTVKPNIFEIFKTIKTVEIHSNSPCYDKNNKPVDATFHNTIFPNALCISTQRLSLKWNIVDFQVRAVALLIHEVFHKLVEKVGAEALGIKGADEEIEAQRIEIFVLNALARENLESYLWGLSFYGMQTESLINKIKTLSSLPYGEKSCNVLQEIDRDIIHIYVTSGLGATWENAPRLHSLSIQWNKIFIGIHNKISMLQIWHCGHNQEGYEHNFDTLFGSDNVIDVCEYEKRTGNILESCDDIGAMNKDIFELLKVYRIDKQVQEHNKNLENEYAKLIKILELAREEAYGPGQFTIEKINYQFRFLGI